MTQSLTVYFNKCFFFVEEWVTKKDNSSIEKTWELFVMSEKRSGNLKLHFEKFIDTSTLAKFTPNHKD